MRNPFVKNFLIDNKKIPIVTSGVIIVLVVLDLLATRQILYFDNTYEIVTFFANSSCRIRGGLLDSFGVC